LAGVVGAVDPIEWLATLAQIIGEQGMINGAAAPAGNQFPMGRVS
jgi:hypothetical protein